MHFVFPTFLYALIALSIPIIIHLFYFRKYKKVFFSDIRFLKEIQKQKSNINQLKQRLILLLRLGTVFFLVLAFAQPFLGKRDSEGIAGSIYAAVYVDNSPSSQLLKNGETILDIEKQQAKSIADALDADDKLALFTNDIYNTHQYWMAKQDFINAIDKISLSYQQKNLEEILLKQNALLQHAGSNSKKRFIISDFQNNFLENFKKDTSILTYLIPVQTIPENNLYVDSCWFESPIVQLNINNKLFVRFKNSGIKSIEKKTVSLIINQQVKGVKAININAHATLIDSFSFAIQNSGFQDIEIKFNDYPVIYDDIFYATFNVKKNENILSIESSHSTNHIAAIFSSDNYFIFTKNEVNQIDYSKLTSYDFIVLNQIDDIPSGLANSLKNYVIDGGSIFIIPSKNINLSSYNVFLNTLKIGDLATAKEQKVDVKQLNLNEKIFKGIFTHIPQNIDLPNIDRFYPIRSNPQTPHFDIMESTGNTALLEKYIVESGIVYFQSASLDKSFSNIGDKAVYAPIVYNMAIQKNYAPPLFYTMGKDNLIILPAQHNSKEQISIANNQQELMPETRTIGNNLLLQFNQKLDQDGIYQVKNSNQINLGSVAFNFDRKESELNFISVKDLEKQFELPNFKILEPKKTNIFTQVKHIKDGIVLWKIFIVLALLCLLLEILLIRFLK